MEAMFVHVVGKIVVKGILTAQLEEGFRQTGERLQGRHEQPRYDMFQSLRHRALRQTLRASAFHRSAAALAGAAASRCATSYTSTETRFMADRRANHAPTGQDWPPVAADAPAPRVGVTPKDWPLLPECIQTPRLLLRRYRLTDAEDVYAYARDPEWGRFLITIEPPYERQHADAFVAECVLEDRRTEHTWALEHEGRVVGGLGLRPVHRHARAELGYSLARWLAVSAVVDEAFRRLPIRKICAIAIAANVGSTRVMEKVGMQREALLRQHRVQHGQTFDEVQYGLLREEWERNASAAG